jgi:hypothetical protein
MKNLVAHTASKSRQPNHIISSGGIINSKLAGVTASVAQDSSLSKNLIIIIETFLHRT